MGTFSCAKQAAEPIAETVDTGELQNTGAQDPTEDLNAAKADGALVDQDPILEAYRNPALRDWVVNFFGDYTGSTELAAVILSNAEVFDVSPALAFALCWEESQYKTHAVNRTNRNKTIDRGLFQLNSATFPKLKEEDFFNPSINAWYGLSHLRWCLDHAGTEVAGLAMYNAGSNRVKSNGTPKKTLDYISRILNRRHKIDERFLAQSIPEPQEEEAGSDNVIAEKPGKFRLNLLAPLGGR
ncbi:MAG: transglycosylase SLT domain-containing protein [Treponema sp.]|nr:transglycosylase SLT domain-containing protein [Treponema sp.]